MKYFYLMVNGFDARVAFELYMLVMFGIGIGFVVLTLFKDNVDFNTFYKIYFIGFLGLLIFLLLIYLEVW